MFVCNSIIYDTIEEIKSAMEGMLSPEIKEEITATVEVLEYSKSRKWVQWPVVWCAKEKSNEATRFVSFAMAS